MCAKVFQKQKSEKFRVSEAKWSLKVNFASHFREVSLFFACHHRIVALTGPFSRLWASSKRKPWRFFSAFYKWSQNNQLVFLHCQLQIIKNKRSNIFVYSYYGLPCNNKPLPITGSHKITNQQISLLTITDNCKEYNLTSLSIMGSHRLVINGDSSVLIKDSHKIINLNFSSLPVTENCK